MELHLNLPHSNVKVIQTKIEKSRESDSDDLWSKIVNGAEELSLPEPEVPRTRKHTHFDDSVRGKPHQFSTAADCYRKTFFEVTDLTNR